MQRSASQTVGPFFLEALIHGGDEIIAKPGTPGETIILEGRVLDAEGSAVTDALLEISQADTTGRYVADSAEARSGLRFTGFGRAATDNLGKFRFTTVYPGVAHAEDRNRDAPHLDVMVFARGLLKPLVTRIYFEGHAGNAHDPVLAEVPESRRSTLEARRASLASAVWEFDVRLQGHDETVFFDF